MVWLLACFWLISRSVKNASRVAPKRSCPFPSWAWRRSAARARSSGTAEKVPVRVVGHQRIAKLFLTAVLGPFERVEDLYIHPELYKRPRRPSRGSENV